MKWLKASKCVVGSANGFGLNKKGKTKCPTCTISYVIIPLSLSGNHQLPQPILQDY